MRFDRALAELDARSNYERSGRLTDPTLDRMQVLMDALGDPHRSFASLHVTGTNGKSTTARAAAEVLRAAGLSVGTYTSPHVSTVRERIAFDGAPISEEAFAEAWGELRGFLGLVDERSERPVTWFEAATALAYMWFADRAVDVAVIEVGMGGRWDATNVVDASAAAFTRVAVDHAQVLGADPVSIAREKAGIVKPGAAVFSVEQEPGVADVLARRCAEVGADLRIEPDGFSLASTALALSGQALSIRLGGERYDDLYVPLYGEHFARDVLLGVAASRALLGEAGLDQEMLAGALANLRVPGRMEVVARAPLVILDGAHNPAGARALARALPASFRYDRLWLVVGVMEDKDIPGTLAPLVSLANEVVVTQADSPRAASADALAREVKALGADATLVPKVADALNEARSRAREGDCVVVSGSLYTVGEARAVLRGPDPEEP